MLLRSLLMALSTYSIFPVPQMEWDPRSWKYAICWFPVVGILIGGIMALWILAVSMCGLSRLLYSCVSVCLPLLLTGGIHMDGYMDTVDALASHQSREKKLQILKDPHIGAFSVIFSIIYFCLSLGLFYELGPTPSAFLICPVYFFSRTLSALCAVTLPNARGGGMLYAFTAGKPRIAVRIVLVFSSAAAAALLLFMNCRTALFPIAIGLLVTIWYRRFTGRQFGGCTGDTAGFFLQLCELMMLAGIVIGASLP